MSITIATDAAGVVVTSPYDPDFVAAARDELGGRPHKGSDGTWTWTFDPRDEQAVRALCRRIYGTDGSDADAPTVTVRVPVNLWGSHKEFRAAGRTLVRRPYRDGSVRLGAGVVVVEGGFPSSGGSMKNPDIAAKPGTVLEVRDLPRGAAELILAEVDGATLVGDDEQHRAELAAERTALLARLAEINAILGDTAPAPA